MSKGEHYTIRETATDRRPVMWQDMQLMDMNFKAILSLSRKNDCFRANLHMGGAHSRVQLYTTRKNEAKRRAEQLYDMASNAVEDVASAAERGFLLRSELTNSNSEDT